MLFIFPNVLYRSHWWGDGGALEGAKDEEEAGGQGDRELRHEPGDCDHDDLHHVDDHKRGGSEVKEIGHRPLREAVQHVEHALPVEQGGEKTPDGEHPACQQFKTLSLFLTPGDEEVLLPASLLGDQVDVPVEHGHKNTHLRMCNLAKILKISKSQN